jgi:hypothetical protein
MKKLIAGVILLGILSSCGNKKTNIDPFASITKEVDSVRQIATMINRRKIRSLYRRMNLSMILFTILLPMMCYSVSV